MHSIPLDHKTYAIVRPKTTNIFCSTCFTKHTSVNNPTLTGSQCIANRAYIFILYTSSTNHQSRKTSSSDDLYRTARSRSLFITLYTIEQLANRPIYIFIYRVPCTCRHGSPGCGWYCTGVSKTAVTMCVRPIDDLCQRRPQLEVRRPSTIRTHSALYMPVTRHGFERILYSVHGPI